VTSPRVAPDALGIAIAMASTTTPKRRTPARPRRQPQQSSLEKALGRLPVGKKATPKKTSSRGGTAGKAAMLTAVAGLAFKNREKIGGMLGKRKAADPKI
jgi:hypothetical protein